tara:strand:- start:790 stop:1005 length:216 start_codon:yes stop_codon:yes gene_type:complete
MKKEDAYVGQIVRFGRKNGEKTLGRVVKVNVKNLKVETMETRGRNKTHRVGGRWTVHPSLCEPVAGELSDE